MLKKTIIVLGALLLLLVLSLIVFLSGGPEFPAETDKIISQAIQSDPPELVHGTTGFAQSGGVKIWYEIVQPPKQEMAAPGDAVLLIMGAGSSSMLWPPDFIQALVQSGYQVIRYDHRGTGMSDWIESWQKDQPYSIEDMAGDALAVLDAAGIKRAHVIGTSMGGMIGQRLAISHGDRVSSLVAMSTSAHIFDPELVGLGTDRTFDTMRLILKYALTGSEPGMIKMMMGFIDMMLSGGIQREDVREVSDLVLYEMRKRRGFNQRALAQHFAAMQVSGSRLEEMANIKCPVLVIHGTADSAVDIAHARKYAKRIPGAQTLWLEGAGHIIQETYMPVMMNAILKLIEAGKAR